jgi:hypothetical protein
MYETFDEKQDGQVAGCGGDVLIAGAGHCRECVYHRYH